MEVEVCQPVRAKANSPWREPWEEGEINQPRQGRKSHSGFASLDPDRLLPPLSGLPIRRQVPIAHAMGYYLAPLPGLVAPVSASPKYKVLTDSFDWRALRQFAHFSVARPEMTVTLFAHFR